MNPLLEQFLQEARENLSYIEKHLEELESGDAELLNGIFRAAHTLKGGSGIVGFESVKLITHSAEDLLDLYRNDKIEYSSAMLDALYDAFDEVLNLIEAAEETEDIVDADEETIENVVSTLNEIMGKTPENEASDWEKPFTEIENLDCFKTFSFDFLQNVGALPLNDTLDHESIKEEKLYAIQFDVDEDCMVYGNDPVYALSLLKEKVVAIYSCMNEETSKSVLSGIDDEDGINLKLNLIAFIKASYAEIEDAIFNFVDDGLFLNLDVATLVAIGQSTETNLDVIKDIARNALKCIEKGSATDLELILGESLSLLGENSLESITIKRAVNIISVCEDLSVLTPLFEKLAGTTNQTAVVKEPVVAQQNSAPIVEEVDEEMKETALDILRQQLYQLEHASNEKSLDYVQSIVTKTAPYIGESAPTFTNHQVALEWLAKMLGEPVSTAQAPAQSSQTEMVSEQSAPKVTGGTQMMSDTKEEKQVNKKAPVKAEAKKSVVGKTVKIEQASIDNLMNLVGELLVAKNSLPYLADQINDMSNEGRKRAILEKYTSINRLSSQLQDLIMSMRMLPISYVFDRYPKLVRDISKNLGKKVKLTLEGKETKLDKNMIEMLADPLIHIMRNSLDHGVEDPETRSAKGKSEEGNITLKAYAQSDKIIIEIIDDGAGINIDKVVNKVLEKGLLSVEEIEAMSEDEKAELVLLPGLSTADTISEYSGRGVGMDVVKKSIEAFGGSISISTKRGEGTRIQLSIPVSLAVTSLLHISLSGIHYGFPMDSVNETVKMSKEDISYLHNEPFVYIRGEVIPLLFIDGMLDRENLDENQLSIVVLNVKGNLLAVVVNELLGQLDVVQKPLEGVLSSHPIFSGTALLGNGQIIMVMDPVGLLSISHAIKSNKKAG